MKRKTQQHRRFLWALGVMTGTSCDGADMAMILTDGKHIKELGACDYVAFPEDLAKKIKKLYGVTQAYQYQAVEKEYTDWITHIIKIFLAKHHHTHIDLIGVHGQTLTHQPKQSLTIQMGDGAYIAQQTSIPTIMQFRQNDIAHGGQGAPLVPIFHKAVGDYQHIAPPFIMLNIGGISNMSFIGHDAQTLIGFDCGIGNNMSDDICQKFGYKMDYNGTFALTGTADHAMVQRWLGDTYFAQAYPKSLDRHYFHDHLWEECQTLSHLPDICASYALF